MHNDLNATEVLTEGETKYPFEDDDSQRESSKDIEYGWRLYFREQTPPIQPEESNACTIRDSCSSLQELQLRSSNLSSPGESENVLARDSPQWNEENCGASQFLVPFESLSVKIIAAKDFNTVQSTSDKNPSRSSGFIEQNLIPSLSHGKPSAASRRERYMRSQAFIALQNHYLEVCSCLCSLSRLGAGEDCSS
jgi:hypothetical protein